MDTLCVDFETYYDSNYSLSKITTQEYIHDALFDVILVSVKENDADPVWFSGNMAETKQWLSMFDWEHSLCIAHNAMFDGAILEQIFDVHPLKYHCTMMGSRPSDAPFLGAMSLAKLAQYHELGDKGTAVHNMLGVTRLDAIHRGMLQDYADYCVQDVELCYKLYEKQCNLPEAELDILDLHVKKFTQPKLVLDKNILEKHLAHILLTKKKLLADAGLDTPESLMSNPKFADALKDLGVDPPLKVSAKTGKEAYAFAKTDAGLRELLDHPDERVQLIVAARLGHKSTLEETRTQRFINLADTHYPICVPLLYYGAHTGRSSGLDKLNLQNLPRGGVLRHSLVAPNGHKVVAGDLSQIEARLVAAFCGQEDLLKAFADGTDVYANFASKVFGYLVTKAQHPKERFIGKACVLQLGYGAGASKFHEYCCTNGAIITERQAYNYVNKYRTTYAKIPAMWDELEEALKIMSHGQQGTKAIKGLLFKNMKTPYPPNRELPFNSAANDDFGVVVLPNGMTLRYCELQEMISSTSRGNRVQKVYTNARKGQKFLWGGAFLENIVQALARIVLRDIELRVSKLGFNAVLNVHDELVYVIEDRKVHLFKELLAIEMTRPVSWMPELPLACEIEHGDNYGECK